MKTPIALLLTLTAVVLAPSPAAAQAAAAPPLITVSGSADVKVAPDEVCLTLGVETRNAALDEAKRENDSRIASVLRFLKESGVKEKDIQTDYISVEPTFEYSKSTKPEIYAVRKSIEVRLTTITNFENILTGVLANGVNHVQGVNFRTSELRKHRDKARALAIGAAKEKAVEMAAALGVRCGKVYMINASDYSGGWYGSYWGSGGGMYRNAAQNVVSTGEPGADGLSIGQITVSATVNVSFLIE